MTTPAFDADGYPTDETLDAIRDWKLEDDFGVLLEFVAAAWRYPEMVRRCLTAHEGYVVGDRPGARHLRLATGGWSGNESVIQALNENTLASLLLWELSARGGLHIYRFPERDASKQTQEHQP